MSWFKRQSGAIFIGGCLSLAASIVSAQQIPLVCDADNNGVIDSRDITLIGQARNTPATGPTDPRDPNHDGIVNVLDGRFCATLCTFASCARAPNIPAPVANSGAEQHVAVGATVQLNGSASVSARGDALTYAWTLESKPDNSSAVLVNPTAVRPTFVADQDGLYEVVLVVTDAHSVVSNQAATLIAAGSAAVPPVANSGTYSTAAIGGKVTLDASKSTDIGGAPLVDTWQFTLVPSNSAATLSTTSGLSPTFTTDLYGQYYLKLSVLDANFNTSTSSVVIDTQPRTRAPTANAGPPQSVALGQSAVLDATASSAPGNATITAYQWVLLSRPAGSTALISSPGAATTNLRLDAAGDYVVELIVTAGGLASAPATVLISTHDVPPSASAGPAQTVYAGDTVFLRGAGTAPDGNPLSYRWSIIESPLGFASIPINGATSPNASFLAGSPGPYLAQLVVNNGHVDSAPSTTVIQANTPTTADLALSQTVSPASPVVGGLLQFTVTVTDLGPLSATGASITDVLPSGLNLVNASPSQGSYNQSSGVWTVGPLSKSAVAQLVLTARPSVAGSVTNAATIANSTPTDSNGANNSASASVTVQQAANLTIVTKVDNLAPLVGSHVVFTTTVTNNGPAAATGAQVADLLPSGFGLVSAQPSSGSYNPGTGLWTIGGLAAGGSATLTVTATVLASGSYADVATVNAANSPNTGANISSTISVSPIFPPAVAITAPASGITLVTPVNLALSVSASSASAQIASLAIFDGGAQIQAVSVNQAAVSFTLTISNISPGVHSYTAVATDTQGLTSTSSAVSVTVVAPTATAALIAPVNNAFFVGPATITLLAQAASSTGRVGQVQFFQNGALIGSAAKAPYSVTLTNIASGSYNFTVKVTDSTSSVTSAPVAVSVGAASSLGIGAPQNGASIADDVTAVSGTVQAPPNSGIMVNGLPASITPDGRYFVNNVPLQPGVNTVQVTLTEPNGTVTTRSLTLTSTGVKPFQMATNLNGPFSATAGLAPLAVGFSISDPGHAPATSIQLSCRNDGTVDYIVANPALTGAATSVGTCSYPSPGVYTALINVVNAPSGQSPQVVYTGTMTVVVQDPVALDAVLRSLWSGMNDALVAGDQTRALSYLDDPAKTTYAPVFSALASTLPSIVASYSDLSQSHVSQTLAEYLLLRPVQGSTKGFLVYFVNTAGVWQLDTM